MELLATILAFCVISSNFVDLSTGENVFDVTKFGAVGNGVADDTKAFVKAWTATCGVQGIPTMVVPSGKTFLLKSVAFQGPCKPSAVHVQVLGTILASKTLRSCFAGSWLYFSDVNGLTVDGSGTIDGQGAAWWNKANLEVATPGSCNGRPAALLVQRCNNFQLSGLTHINSPGLHILITDSNDVVVSKLRITAPEQSPNTDGINLIRTTRVQIKDSVIGTGDDCIAVNQATSGINISNIVCGPGHGISIGSLGGGGAFESSESVRVRNCTFIRTQNGARIKTYSGGKGFVRNVVYDGITLNEVDNPIIIDQNYCNGHKGCPRQPNGLQVSDVSFTNIHGTSSQQVGIKLNCNTGNGCKNIKMNNVKIMSASSGKAVAVQLTNVQGTATDTIPVVHMNS